MKQPIPQVRVTLSAIAGRLQVSHTTVSRALRGDTRISEPVRRQIQDLAQALGYRPDPMLSALAHYRHSKSPAAIAAELAWINHWPDPKRLRSFREFDLYWKGASEEAERCGFRLEEFVMDKEMSPSRLEKILLTRNIQGVLLPPHRGFAPAWRDFHWDKFCVVRFGYSLSTPRAHVVTSDQLTDGLIAFENIWAHGYRRIGLVTLRESATRFGAGYLFSQIKLSPQLRLPPLIISETNGEADVPRIKTWIRKHKPDAILTDDRKLCEILTHAGCQVPQDIGLAATSVLDGGVNAGIDQNSEEIGSAAVQMLISLINHNERGIPKICRELLIEGHWVDGSTLPAKKNKTATNSRTWLINA